MKKEIKTTKIKKVKKMTIEDLALMVAKGFEGTATKDDVNAIIVRLDRIEYLLIRALENRTEKLEDEVRILKTTVARLLQKT